MNNIIFSIFYTFKRTLKIKERSNRKEFNVFFIFFHVYTCILYYIEPTRKKNYLDIDIIFILLYGLIVIFGLLFILSLFSLIIRRIHDLNTSAWWLLITLVPLGGLLFFALPFKKGTDGPNKYGEPPKY